ncbi:Auxin-responsive protein SAUR32 [Glycine soja]|uniref:Uncharacterized protein n=2 Tax=Glycine subgen. Soja TaxID=1462606 RepID=A0A0R0EQ57_SOYBN|nr:Auxin-responsive protein SAUR32 [Glycine soja]
MQRFPLTRIISEELFISHLTCCAYTKGTNTSNQVLEAVTLVPEDVMEGHFAVLAIKGEDTRRFIVKLDYLTDPMFMELLNQAREEYGFKQKGALAVPCRPQELQNILDGPRAKAER